MDCEWALGELSTAHAVALRMRRADPGAEQIATALGFPPDGVPVLLALAEAKLSAVLVRSRPIGERENVRRAAGSPWSARLSAP